MSAFVLQELLLIGRLFFVFFGSVWVCEEKKSVLINIGKTVAAQKSHAAVLEICEEVEHFIIVDDPESTGIYYLEFLIVLLRDMLSSDIILVYFQAVSKPVSKGFPDTAHLRNQASQAAKQLADLHASVTYAQNSHQKRDVSRFKKKLLCLTYLTFFQIVF